MEQDTGKFRTNTKDQYYTKSSIAKDCIDCILAKCPEVSQYQWIEPSAGNGSFLKALPADIPRIGIDLDPKMEGVLKGDFLAWEPSSEAKPPHVLPSKRSLSFTIIILSFEVLYEHRHSSKMYESVQV